MTEYVSFQFLTFIDWSSNAIRMNEISKGNQGGIGTLDLPKQPLSHIEQAFLLSDFASLLNGRMHHQGVNEARKIPMPRQPH